MHDDTCLKTDNADVVYCLNNFSLYRILCKCSLYHKRPVLGITNGCRLRNRHALLDVDIYILDFLAHKHARTLMTDDGWNFLDAV